jgi:hypothetical protein
VTATADQIQNDVTPGHRKADHRDQEQPLGCRSRHACAFGKRLLDRKHHRVVEPWQEECGHQQRDDHGPIEHEIARHGGDERPHVGREHASGERQVAAGPSHPIDRSLVVRGCPRFARIERPQHLVAAVRAVSVQPGGEPAADIATAGHRGEVIELAEDADVCKALQHAERKRGAANAAA